VRSVMSAAKPVANMVAVDDDPTLAPVTVAIHVGTRPRCRGRGG
jgi:hypothetical protein